jgi:hypothetical protein
MRSALESSGHPYRCVVRGVCGGWWWLRVTAVETRIVLPDTGATRTGDKAGNRHGYRHERHGVFEKEFFFVIVVQTTSGRRVWRGNVGTGLGRGP